jgi:spoIIIJ-associated protein
VREALLAALSEALDVDAGRLEVRLTLDGAAVPDSHLPLRLELDRSSRAAAATAEPADDAGDDDAGDDDAQQGVGGTAGREDDRVTAPRSVSDGRSSGGGRDRAEGVPVSAEDLDEEAEAAADLLEGLLDALDLPGDLRISVQDAHAEVEVVGLEEGVLIGRRGQTLEAIQELVRTAMQRRFERRSRVLVDVDGYRARRLEKLLERAEDAVREVLDSGEPQRLEPMDAIERRLVHQRVAETAGVISTSHGREPARRIVIELADD